MDFNLIRQESEPKVTFGLRIYASSLEQVEKIAKAEKITPAAFVRHAINKALQEYDHPEA